MITFAELKKHSEDLYPALLMERSFPYRTRKAFRTILLVSTIMALFAMLYIHFVIGVNGTSDVYKIRGGFFLIFLATLFAYLTEWFYLSFYFKKSLVDFEVAQLVFWSDHNDVIKSFLESEIGNTTIDRLNIPDASVAYFVNNKDRKRLREIDVQFLETSRGETTSVLYGEALYKHDAEFRYFLDINMVDQKTFLEALQWADEILYERRKFALFLSRERLERIPSIGKTWDSAQFSVLTNYCVPIYKSRMYTSLGEEWRIYKKEAQEVENILAQKRGQNVLLVTPTIESGMEIVSALGQIILRGNALYALEGKEIYFLSPEKFMDKVQTKEEFEHIMRHILAEAHENGDVILVLPQTSRLIERAHQLGLDASEMVINFLKSKELNIIAVVDTDEYHSTIAPHSEFVRNFEKIQFAKIDHKTLHRILKDQVKMIESEEKVFFTYQVIRDVAARFAGPSIDGTYLLTIVKFLKTLAKNVRRDGERVVTSKYIDEIK